ncbi:MAG TPA: FABP family protein [Mycobacteriales bacterium]|nr:FABP family protein [Mycobacteriales bacterium]
MGEDRQPDELPEVLRPLAFLVGTWRGEGQGAVPGGGAPDFPYAEELTIRNDDGLPWLTYATRAVHPVEREIVLHVEHGWIRPQPVDAGGKVAVEMVVALPTGIVEVLIGEIVEGPAGAHLELASDVIARTPTASQVSADKRLYAVRGGKLMYAIDLATGDAGLVPHLAAALDRES